MYIRVIYNDGKYDMVRAFTFDYFLGENKIKKFYRNCEKQWVTVGLDPVRKSRREEGHSDGQERRKKDLL